MKITPISGSIKLNKGSILDLKLHTDVLIGKYIPISTMTEIKNSLNVFNRRQD